MCLQGLACWGITTDVTRLPDIAPPGWFALWAGGTVALIILYALVFWLTGSPLGWALADAAANALSLAGVAAVTHEVLKAQLAERSTAAQALIHLGAAPAFALAWYSLLLMLLGIAAWLGGRPFGLVPFRGPAFVWQVFQGLIVYALVAATGYALRGGRQAGQVTIVDRPPPLERYLVKRGDEIAPIAVDEIVTIIGAQDYAEVSTARGKHLVRLSLGEFETRLDAQRFLRVHRSAIINFARLDRVEPAGGGRMIAWMDNGESVPVSRAGAQLLRSFTV